MTKKEIKELMHLGVHASCITCSLNISNIINDKMKYLDCTKDEAIEKFVNYIYDKYLPSVKNSLYESI
jgi:hypothetical protein